MFYANLMFSLSCFSVIQENPTNRSVAKPCHDDQTWAPPPTATEAVADQTQIFFRPAHPRLHLPDRTFIHHGPLTFRDDVFKRAVQPIPLILFQREKETKMRRTSFADEMKIRVIQVLGFYKTFKADMVNELSSR